MFFCLFCQRRFEGSSVIRHPDTEGLILGRFIDYWPSYTQCEELRMEGKHWSFVTSVHIEIWCLDHIWSRFKCWLITGPVTQCKGWRGNTDHLWPQYPLKYGAWSLDLYFWAQHACIISVSGLNAHASLFFWGGGWQCWQLMRIEMARWYGPQQWCSQVVCGRWQLQRSFIAVAAVGAEALSQPPALPSAQSVSCVNGQSADMTHPCYALLCADFGVRWGTAKSCDEKPALVLLTHTSSSLPWRTLWCTITERHWPSITMSWTFAFCIQYGALRLRPHPRPTVTCICACSNSSPGDAVVAGPVALAACGHIICWQWMFGQCPRILRYAGGFTRLCDPRRPDEQDVEHLAWHWEETSPHRLQSPLLWSGVKLGFLETFLAAAAECRLDGFTWLEQSVHWRTQLHGWNFTIMPEVFPERKSDFRTDASTVWMSQGKNQICHDKV